MYFGMRGHDFEADSVAALAKKCQSHNIHHIQLALKKTVAGFKEGMFNEEYAKKIADELKEGELYVSVLGCYINPSDTNPETLKKSLDFFVENLDYAKYMNAQMVGLETGFVGEALDKEKNQTEEAYQYLLKNMRYLVAEAEKRNVNIGIEGVGCYVINSPKRMKRLVDDLNSKNVCVIFDPVNYLDIDNYAEQDKIFDEFFDLLGDKTKVLHLKDFSVGDGELKYEYPTKGLLHTERIINKMREYNPNIPIMLEEVKEDMLEKVKESLKDLVL